MSTSSSSSKWSNHIPQEIMEEILQRLCVNDYITVGKVCSSWRSAVARAKAERRCFPKYQLPHLLIFKTLYSYHPNQFLNIKDHTLVNLYDGGRVSHSSHAELFGKYCFGSVEGWLIIADAFLQPHLRYYTDFYVNIMFFNPLSRAKVILPTIGSPKNKCILFLRKAVASTVPDGPDCLVAAISTKGDLIFCRPSYKIWLTLHAHRDQEYFQHREIGIHDGKLYALSFSADYAVSVYNLLSCYYSIQNRVVIKIDPWADDALIDSWVQHNHLVLGSNISCFHLVTDFISNELLLIAQIAYEYISTPPKTKLFRVFRLDQSGSGRDRWLPLESLGDRILFISHTSCMCLSASVIRERGYFKFEEVEDELLNRGNCIFFAFNYAWTDYEFHDLC